MWALEKLSRAFKGYLQAIGVFSEAVDVGPGALHGGRVFETERPDFGGQIDYRDDACGSREPFHHAGKRLNN